MSLQSEAGLATKEEDTLLLLLLLCLWYVPAMPHLPTVTRNVAQLLAGIRVILPQNILSCLPADVIHKEFR